MIPNTSTSAAVPNIAANGQTSKLCFFMGQNISMGN